MNRKQVTGLSMGAVAGMVLYGCAVFSGDWHPTLVEGTKTAAVAHQSGRAIDVSSENGSIRVTKADRSDVEITASIRARTQERLDAAAISARRGEDGTLYVTMEWPDDKRHGDESCSFNIAMPNAVGVVLETSNGGLTIEGLSGSARLHTSNGGIHATAHDGPVEANTSNGTVHVDRAQGTVDARSSNGRVEVGEATSAVYAQTSNGAVAVRLAPGNPGPVLAKTSNGGIDLEITPAFAGELVLETSQGGINADNLAGARLISSSKDRLRLGFGNSAAKSSATTSNGSVTVRMRP